MKNDLQALGFAVALAASGCTLLGPSARDEGAPCALGPIDFERVDSAPGSVVGFIRVDGENLVTASGARFFIRGVNLGNWLNPEGYMFGFGPCDSPHFIDRALREMVGDEVTDEFWRRFKDNYVTEEDIAFIASTGANTVRLPFHYKLFTDEDYLGLSSDQDGFRRLDDVVRWCRAHGLKVILDMHDCPGGQTGDNIDDSHGYPWLFESEKMQRLYCDIWRRVAARYADDDTVLGYDLMNEPISSRLPDMEEINKSLERVQFRAIDAIREVDRNHIVMLDGAQWNNNFEPFSDFGKDPNMLYTCHRYWTEPGCIADYTAFRARSGRPLYMGETGHNTYAWYRAFTATMERNNIGWTYWPHKMPGRGGWLGFEKPADWDLVVKFAKADRSSYAKIQAARPDRARAAQALMEFAENCKFSNCTVDVLYLEAIGLNEEAR